MFVLTVDDLVDHIVKVVVDARLCMITVCVRFVGGVVATAVFLLIASVSS